MKNDDAMILAALLKQQGKLNKPVQYASDKYYVELIDSATKQQKRFVVQLTHDIVKRMTTNHKTNSQEPRYSVYDSSHYINKGQFGRIYDVVGTLMFVDDGSVKIKMHKERVMKVQEYSTNRTLVRDAQNAKERIESEAALSQSTPHMHSKPLTIDEKKKTAYLLMKKFSGSTMSGILENDARGYRSLSSNERLQLSVQLLHALQYQIHESGLIHRDVKPDNIIVDLKTMNVNIIDLGLSRRQVDHDNQFPGTPDYAAPEVHNEACEPDQVSDTYSIGLVIGMLWGAEFVKLNNKRSYDVSKMCVGKDINDLEMSEIKKTVLGLIEEDRSKRLPISDAINSINTIITDRLLKNANADNHEHVKKAISVGIAYRNLFSAKKNIKTINDIEEALSKAFSEIADNPDAIKAFVKTLGVNQFQSMTNKAEIIDSVKQLDSDYQAWSLDLRKAIDEIEDKLFVAETLNVYPTYQNSYNILTSMKQDLNNHILRLECHKSNIHEIQAVMTKLADDFSSYAKSLEVIRIEENRCHFELSQIVARLKPVPSRDRVIMLINSIHEGIQSYIINEITLKPSPYTSFFNKDPIDDISKARRDDVNKILSEIDEEVDEDVIISKVKVICNELKTGITGNSKLRDSIMTSIDHFLSMNPKHGNK